MLNSQHETEVSASVTERRTSPDALMKLFLRFDTPEGPRTIIAPNVPLAVASQIAAAMSRTGQHAHYVDQYVTVPIAGRLGSAKHHRANILTLPKNAA